MANTDFPRGLWPAGHLTGGCIKSHPFILTTGQIVRQGEVLIGVAGGTVEDATEGQGYLVVGVAANYVSDAGSAGGKTVQVFCDPNIIFGIQAVTGDTPASTDVFSRGDIVACSSSNEFSNSELDIDGEDQVTIIGLVNEPGNSWGEHAKVLVIFNEHYMKGDNVTVTAI